MKIQTFIRPKNSTHISDKIRHISDVSTRRESFSFEVFFDNITHRINHPSAQYKGIGQ